MRYLQRTSMADISQVVFGMFVAKPLINSPLLSLTSTVNVMMQVNDGTLGAEAMTKYERPKVISISAAGEFSEPFMATEVPFVSLSVSPQFNFSPPRTTEPVLDAFVNVPLVSLYVPSSISDFP